MIFDVISNTNRIPEGTRSKIFLIEDNWDDWFTYNTLYSLYFCDENGDKSFIGGVKIGQFGMIKDQRRAHIPVEFEQLGEEFFSLGQDDSYYENLNKLGQEFREQVLSGLHDVTLDRDLLMRALEEDVMKTSLLRSVSLATVNGQFHRLARGGVRLSQYEFKYTYMPKKEGRLKSSPVTLSFIVEPESMPPTNIHVLIGRNGVGKTHLLNYMTQSLVDNSSNTYEFGSFEEVLNSSPNGSLFANLVSVTFSAFDSFEPLPESRDKSKGMQYSYVGLKKRGIAQDGKPLPPKSPANLATEFANSVFFCIKGARLLRWRRALEILDADPIFHDANIAELPDIEQGNEIKDAARKLFGKLSSGHKIVLLTITRLVETAEERTLVLLDEPEAHLHPPLLSAFVRTLSDLLINRNGVAIIATHSPVVLQEVPQSCVWKIHRSGANVKAERPNIETFGENVGILTREIFGLEVTHSGFHKLLDDMVKEGGDFQEVLSRFNQNLGGEARAIANSLIANRYTENPIDDQA